MDKHKRQHKRNQRENEKIKTNRKSIKRATLLRNMLSMQNATSNRSFGLFIRCCYCRICCLSVCVREFAKRFSWKWHQVSEAFHQNSSCLNSFHDFASIRFMIYVNIHNHVPNGTHTHSLSLSLAHIEISCTISTNDSDSAKWKFKSINDDANFIHVWCVPEFRCSNRFFSISEKIALLNIINVILALAIFKSRSKSRNKNLIIKFLLIRLKLHRFKSMCTTDYG